MTGTDLPAPTTTTITELIGLPGSGKSTVARLVGEMAGDHIATKSDLSGGDRLSLVSAGTVGTVMNWRPIALDVVAGAPIKAVLRYSYWQVVMARAIAAFLTSGPGARVLLLDQGFGQASASLLWRGSHHLSLELMRTLGRLATRQDCVYRLIRLKSEPSVSQHRLENRTVRTSPLDGLAPGPLHEQLEQWDRAIGKVVQRIADVAPDVQQSELPTDGSAQEAARLLLEACE